MLETVKIPKKFGDICALVRDGQEGGMEKLVAYRRFRVVKPLR